MIMKNPSQICRDAAQLIRARGHAKHSYVGADGGLCLMGALRIAAFGKVCVCTSEFPRGIWGAFGMPRSSLAFWNDAPERTPAEVIAALEAAADKLEVTP